MPTKVTNVHGLTPGETKTVMALASLGHAVLADWPRAQVLALTMRPHIDAHEALAALAKFSKAAG